MLPYNLLTLLLFVNDIDFCSISKTVISFFKEYTIYILTFLKDPIFDIVVFFFTSIISLSCFENLTTYNNLKFETCKVLSFYANYYANTIVNTTDNSKQIKRYENASLALRSASCKLAAFAKTTKILKIFRRIAGIPKTEIIEDTASRLLRLSNNLTFSSTSNECLTNKMNMHDVNIIKKNLGIAIIHETTDDDDENMTKRTTNATPCSFNGEIAAKGGKYTHAEQPQRNSEITNTKKKK